jgi:hypothetical protein
MADTNRQERSGTVGNPGYAGVSRVAVTSRAGHGQTRADTPERVGFGLDLDSRGRVAPVVNVVPTSDSR